MSADLIRAEELLLLLLDDDKGRPVKPNGKLGLAAAVLVDLVAGGWLVEDGKDLVPAAGAQAPRHPVLADALAAIGDERPHKPKWWVRKLPGRVDGLQDRVAHGLVERGVLDEERHKVLGLVERTRYPEADPAPERALRERLRTELTADGDASRETALLAPLLVPMKLVSALVDRSDRGVAKKRAKALGEELEGEVGRALKSVIDGQNAAMVAATSSAATS